MKSLLGRCAAALVTAGCGGYLAAGLAASSAPRVALEASKYAFSAREIRLKKGERVTFVLTSPDFVHGFSVPDFDVRADAVPGKAVELTFTPNRAGRFVYLCDNFCGEGHDRMSGFLVVTD